MARCPHCQHELSNEELQSNHCSACGNTFEGSLSGDGSSPESPGKPSASAGSPGKGPVLPDAIRGKGGKATGLSSASDPETWNEDSNARTYEASEMAADEGSGTPSANVPKPLDLNDDDVVRMSILWGDVDDEVPSGMTIKSRESSDVDDNGETLDVHNLVDEDGFSADDSAQTYSPDSDDEGEADLSSIAETFISDQFAPVNPEDSAGDESGSAESDSADESHATGPLDNIQRHDTPPESGGGTSFDQTVVAEDFVSDEHDSREAAEESARTMPLDADKDWAESENAKTFVAGNEEPARNQDADSVDDAKGNDSTDKTIISDSFSDEQHTDSGSTDAGQRTDPLGTADSAAGVDFAEGTGLVINARLLIDQKDPGSEKADYQILSLLGEGGMGKVFNARQTSIDRVVALKMLKPKSSGRKRDQYSKFLAEAVVTGELDHPNIVPIYDVGKNSQNDLFYSMKNVTGNPWLDTIHQKSAHDNLEILMSVADAVAFAHARGVVHRDLKPENVMLGEFGEVLVMDWGLAMPTDKFRKQRNIVRSSSMGGTPAYMAPEMATGPISKIGSHSDIYLLGAILFEIVTGRPPHRGKNAMKCLMAAARNKIVTTEHTGELIEIAYKAMSTNPKDRYKSVQEFQQAVRTYLAHSESITLAALAEEDLERAQTTDNYEDYAKARFGFEEALKLWAGNKRARSSLGAARLAYARCAKDKGDYDLADSLLDAQDMSHEKLRVDIAKAREERDARQKRLEAAKRTGLALALLLFVVVSGAAFWINDARLEAASARDVAVAEKQKAVEAEEREREAKQEAIAAAEIQRQLRAAAEAQSIVASLNAIMADEQKLLAEAAAEAERLAKIKEQEALEQERVQRALAVQRRKEAEAQSIVASLNAVMADEQKLLAEAAAEAERLAKIQEQKALENEKVQRELAEQRREEAEAQSVVASLNSIMAEEQKLLAEAAAEAEEKAKVEAIRQEQIAKDQEAKAIIARERAEAEQVVASLNAIMAEEQKLLAEAAAEAERVALLKEQKALEQEKIQRERAEIERQRAEAEQVVASLNAVMAEEQKQLAEIAARKEREAKIEEQRKAYIARVGLAAAKIEENVFDVAENLLEGTNPLFRNWEWGYLKHLCQQAERDFNTPTPLESIALIGGGPNFVVAGEQGLVQIRNIDNPQEIVQTLQLPDNLKDFTVFDVAVSPSGQLVALATNDHSGGYIKLWDIPNQELVKTTFGNPDTTFNSENEYRDKLRTRHMDPVVSVQFSRDGSKLLTASQDETARVWEVRTGNQLVSLPGENTKKNGHFGIVWDAVFVPNLPTGANDQRGSETTIITVGEDKKALVWVDPSGEWADHGKIQLLPPFTAHQDPIYSVACSPDGEYVATGGFGRRVLLWRIQDIPRLSERELFQLRLDDKPLPQTPFRQLLGHDGPIRAIDFTAPAQEAARDLVLVTGSDDNTVKVWNVDRKSLLDQITPIKTFRGHGGYVRDCVFNPQGTWIVSVSHDTSAKRWSLGEEANTEVYLVNGSPLDGHKEDVDAVAFSPESQTIVTASRDNTAQLYRATGKNHWQRAFTLREGHTHVIPSAVYFDGGRQLATASYDRTVRVWDVASGTEKFQLTETGSHAVVAVSPDGRWILTGSNRAGKAKLWDTQNLSQPVEFGDHSSPVTAVAFAKKPSANGQLQLATGDNIGRCAVWQWAPNTKKLGDDPRMLVRFDNQKAHEEGIVAMHFLPGEQRLLTASLDYAVSQWDLTTGKAVEGRDLTHPAEVTSLSVTPDGTRAVTTCNDNIVRLWNLETTQPIREFRPVGRSKTLLANVRVQFDRKKLPNETLGQAWELFNPGADLRQFLAQGGWNQGVAALETQLPEQLENLKAPPRELAQKLASRIGDVSAEDLLSASVNSAAISPDGLYVAVANQTDDIVHIWRIPASSSTYTEVIEDKIDDDRQVSAVVFSPMEMRTELTVLGFSDARPWRLTTTADNTLRKTAALPMNAQDDVASAAFSSDGKYVVTAARDKAARVWSVEKGRTVAKLQGEDGHADAVNIAVWAPDTVEGGGNARHILTAGDDAQAILWKLTEKESGFQAEVVRSFKTGSAAILDVAFSPDGSWFVTVSNDGTLCLWDTSENEKPVFVEKQTAPLLCVACSHDGKEILTGSENNQAIVWSVIGSGKGIQLKAALLLAGHSARVTDVAFSPLEDVDGDGKISQVEKEGQRAVTASGDNTVIVWDTRIPEVSEKKLPEASQVLTLKRHNRPVNAVRFSPNGRYILTGSEDHRAIVWPTEDWLSEKRAAYQKYLEEKKQEPQRKPLTVSTSLLTN